MKTRAVVFVDHLGNEKPLVAKTAEAPEVGDRFCFTDDGGEVNAFVSEVSESRIVVRIVPKLSYSREYLTYAAARASQGEDRPPLYDAVRRQSLGGFLTEVAASVTDADERPPLIKDEKDEVRLAREARKEAKRAAKLQAVERVANLPPIEERQAQEAVHSEDNKALFAFLLAHPNICARLYDRLAVNASRSALTPHGNGLAAIVVCDQFYGSRGPHGREEDS